MSQPPVIRGEKGFLIAVFIALCLLAVPLLPPFWTTKTSHDTRCRSQLKQIATAMNNYLTDFDERFPAKTWADELQPYLKQPDLYHCPEVLRQKGHWGYAMNYKLMGRGFAVIQNAVETPMFFEIDALAKDVVANVGARSTSRHKNSSCIAFVDSHARFKKGSETVKDLP